MNLARALANVIDAITRFFFPAESALIDRDIQPPVALSARRQPYDWAADKAFDRITREY